MTIGLADDPSIPILCDPLIFWPPVIPLGRLKLKSSNFVYRQPEAGWHNNKMTYDQQKGRGYGHVTVLKFCRFVLMQRVARVCQLCRAGFYQLRQIRPAIRSLTTDAARTTVQAFIACDKSHLRALVTDCAFLSRFSGTPYRSELHQFKRCN